MGILERPSGRKDEGRVGSGATGANSPASRRGHPTGSATRRKGVRAGATTPRVPRTARNTAVERVFCGNNVLRLLRVERAMLGALQEESFSSCLRVLGLLQVQLQDATAAIS